MWRERGLTMVLVTHDSSIARRAQRIGVMKNGRLTFKQPRPGQSRPGQSRPARAADPADFEPHRLQAPDLEDNADLEDDADLGSERPAFTDPDSEPADTVTFD
jgi:ABC-type multidrug transport system ATPase subunit